MYKITGGNTEGFTLLEILIAVAVFSMIVGALYTTFFLTHKSLDGMERSLIQLQDSRAFVDTLKREMESVLYSQEIGYSLFKIEDRDYYGRQASGLTMTAFSPLVKGLARITYYVEEKNGRLAITKSVASVSSHEETSPRFELLEDIESFTLEAKYADKWVKTWDSSLSGNTPDEVRISLNLRTKKSDDTGSAAAFHLFDTSTLRVGRPI
jgi:general secretion pathway protein J